MTYPSISFKTTKNYPQPVRKPWRDTIALVGEFTKGPAAAVSVTPTEYELLFGDDTSEGAVNVQQIYSLGATNLTISRAIPEDSPSRLSFTVASGNLTKVEPIVGYEVDSTEYNPTINETAYTVGLSLKASYVGSAFLINTIYSEVATKDSYLDHPTFNDKNEQANLDFTVVDFVAGNSTPEVKHPTGAFLTLTGVVAAANTYQKVIISTTEVLGANDYSAIDQAIKPGYVFEYDAAGSTERLLILSTPKAVSTDSVMVVVKALTAVSASAITGAQVKDPVSDRYILGYRLNLIQSSVLITRTAGQKYFILPSESYDDTYGSIPIDAYIDLDSLSTGQYQPFKYFTISDTAADTTASSLATEGFSSLDTEGVLMLYGKESVPDRISLLKGGRFRVPLASAIAGVGGTTSADNLAYGPGTTGKKIIQDLSVSLFSSTTFQSLIADVEPKLQTYPYGLELVSSLKSIEANRIKLSIVKYTEGAAADAKDIYVALGDVTSSNPTTHLPVSTFKAMTGAFSGPTYASRDFYSIDGTPILRVQALSPGPVDIKVSVTPQNSLDRNTTKFLLAVDTVVNNQVRSEVFSLDTKSVDATNGLFLQSSESGFIRAYFLPYLEGRITQTSPKDIVEDMLSKTPMRVAPPLGYYSSNYDNGNTAASAYGSFYTSNVPLEGGSNSARFNYTPPLTETEVRRAAYLAAVRRIKDVDAAFVIISGITYGDPAYLPVFQEAISQVDNASVETGLRQLFLETPINMSARQAESLTLAINNPYVSLINGHIVQRLENDTFFRNSGVLGYYAATLATRPPHIAPHAAYGANFLPNILSADTKNNPEYKTAVSEGRVDSLYFDSSLRAWKFLNGLTTSSDFTNRYVSVNRLRIQIISDLYNYLQWARSQPNDRSLQNQVTTAIDAYMSSKLQEGWLLRLGDTVCGPINNTEADMIQGRLNIQISYVPVVPADYIFVNLIEDYTLVDNLTVQTASS